MQRIPRDRARKFAFDWRDEPLLTVRPNESFEVETWDASSGYFKTPDDKAIPGKRPGFDRNPPLVNPIAGPVFVEGAERGDTVAITIESTGYRAVPGLAEIFLILNPDANGSGTMVAAISKSSGPSVAASEPSFCTRLRSKRVRMLSMARRKTLFVSIDPSPLGGSVSAGRLRGEALPVAPAFSRYFHA